jgi:hypothetical protein
MRAMESKFRKTSHIQSDGHGNRVVVLTNIRATELPRHTINTQRLTKKTLFSLLHFLQTFTPHLGVLCLLQRQISKLCLKYDI